MRSYLENVADCDGLDYGAESFTFIPSAVCLLRSELMIDREDFVFDRVDPDGIDASFIEELLNEASGDVKLLLLACTGKVL